MAVAAKTIKQNSLIITQINNNQYLLEGKVEYAKFNYVVEPIINSVDISNGPLIHLGKDFFGKGKVRDIELIEYDPFIIKITLRN
jgi:hypothetical protein